MILGVLDISRYCFDCESFYDATEDFLNLNLPMHDSVVGKCFSNLF